MYVMLLRHPGPSAVDIWMSWGQRQSMTQICSRWSTTSATAGHMWCLLTCRHTNMHKASSSFSRACFRTVARSFFPSTSLMNHAMDYRSGDRGPRGRCGGQVSAEIWSSLSMGVENASNMAEWAAPHFCSTWSTVAETEGRYPFLWGQGLYGGCWLPLQVAGNCLTSRLQQQWSASFSTSFLRMGFLILLSLITVHNSSAKSSVILLMNLTSSPRPAVQLFLRPMD